jgi:hypothetical protein
LCRPKLSAIKGSLAPEEEEEGGGEGGKEGGGGGTVEEDKSISVAYCVLMA